MSDSLDDSLDDKVKKKQHNPDELVIQNVMRTEQGRDYIWKLLQLADVFENIFEPDPLQHAYRAGARKIGVLIAEELKQYAPDYYIKMIKENIDG